MLGPLGGWAQQPAPTDTASALQLEELVVTATRTQRRLDQLPTPVTVITAQEIRQQGAMRLDEVLAQQTGVVLVHDHGTGLQLQGIDDDYILILIDGEPLVGRTAGTLDLSRLTVQNVERIEILKGPASSLYGSEALGGVVNIITRKPPSGRSIFFRNRLGSNHTWDTGLDVGLRGTRTWAQATVNRYATGGYDFSPEAPGATVSPSTHYTAGLKAGHWLTDHLQAEVSMRGYTETQQSAFALADGSLVQGTGEVKEWNLRPALSWTGTQWKLRASYYATGYQTNEVLRYAPSGTLYDDTYFTQTFQRPEVQADWQARPNLALTLGTGTNFEAIEATRYDARQRQHTAYLYAQADWQLLKRLGLLAGLRFDAPSAYRHQLSPKLGLNWQTTKALRLTASVSAGFKAPDFRQLYLNFTNSAVGYAVFGTAQAAERLRALAAAGRISGYFVDTTTLGQPLLPESSWAFNLGATVQATPALRLSTNLFYNRIRNLIETYAIARQTNEQSVFSYRNLSRIFTWGAEVEAAWQMPLKGLTLKAGYQFLQTGDEAVLDGIANRQYYRRNNQGVDVPLKASEYRGLANRSTHTANLRLAYNSPNQRWQGTLRGVYRSAFGLGDTNGNAILDDYDQLAPGYATLDANVGHTFGRWLTLLAGLDNALGYTDPTNMPALPGRLWYVTVQVQLPRLNP